MELIEIAHQVLGEDEIASVPVCGVTAEWFVNQFQRFVDLCPKAAAWEEQQIYNTMCHLYLLDPEELVEWL
jgi:hypothetical protein